MKLERGTVAHFAMMADRRHVGESYRDTLRYARSRLAPGVWLQLTRANRRTLMLALARRRESNRALYAAVTAGRL